MAALDAYDAGDLQGSKDHLLLALEWPENLGQGRPYEPEERLVRFILGHVEVQLGNPEAAGETAGLRPQLEGMVGSTRNDIELALIRRALGLGGG